MSSWHRTVLLLLVSLCAITHALRFHVPSNEKKCLKEEIHRNVVLTGEYEFTEAMGTTASVHVSNLSCLSIIHGCFRLLTLVDTLCKFFCKCSLASALNYILSDEWIFKCETQYLLLLFSGTSVKTSQTLKVFYHFGFIFRCIKKKRAQIKEIGL